MRRLTTLTLGGLLALAAGCAEDLPELPNGGNGTAELRLAAISSDNVVVGETLEFYGTGFVHGDEGVTRVRFDGVFIDAAGGEHRVESLFAPTVYGGLELDDAGEPVREVLTWSRVGPFANPFTGDARHGTFRGAIRPVAEAADGTYTEGSAVELELKVGPSIVVEALEPIEAECGAPAARGLAGLPYRLRVRTTGIKPTRFDYEVPLANGQDVARFIHDFGRGNPVGSDVLGEDEAVIFNQIPGEKQSYVSGIRVVAYDDEGNFVETALPFSIHRPMEVRYEGGYDLAERYDPIPVSGCIPGSLNSRVQYEESSSEARQQSVNVTVSRTFSQSQGERVSQNMREGISEGQSSSRSITNSEWEGESLQEGQGLSYSQNASNNVGFSTNDGETWGWDMSEGESNEDYESRMADMFGEASVSGKVGVKGEGSVPGFAKVSGSVETSVGVSVGARTGNTQGNRTRTSTSRGYGMGGSRNTGRSFGSTVAEGQTESVNGTYALSQQRSQTSRDEESARNTRTWAFGSGVALDQVASTGEGERVSETWVETNVDTLRQGFSALIPRNRVGIFYRQTTRWVRRAEVRTYDMCGLAKHGGELQFNEWTWAPDLAIGASCDSQPPPSNLPAARCFIPPCGG